MNERIEEISLQCIRYKLIAEGARSDFDYQKFAELIIRECATVITETRWRLPPTQQQIAVGIKEHFGVN